MKFVTFKFFEKPYSNNPFMVAGLRLKKTKKHKRAIGSSFEDLDLKELIQKLRSISKMLQSLHSSLEKL